MKRRARRFVTWRLGLRARGSDLVSVVVTATAAQGAFLDECLDSIRAQGHTNLQIIVVPVGDAGNVRRVARAHVDADWRVQVADEVHDDLAAARNHGVELARGSLLVFVAGADLVPPAGLTTLAHSLRASGSQLAVGARRDPAGTAAGHQRVYARSLQGATLTAFPLVLADPAVEGRAFRSGFWREKRLTFPPGSGPETALPMISAYLQADRFDVLAETVYTSMGRGDGFAFGQMPDHTGTLMDWLTTISEIRRKLEPVDEELYRSWLVGLLAQDAMMFAGDAERMDGETWSRYQSAVRDLVGDRWDRVSRELTAECRVQAWLAIHNKKLELEQFVASRWLPSGEPSTVRDGRVFARLPFFGDPDVGVPDDCYLLTPAETPLRASLQGVRWRGSDLELDLFAFVDRVDLGVTFPRTTASLVNADAAERIGLEVRHFADERVNRFAGHRFQDYAHGAATVRIDAASLAQRTRSVAAGTSETWTLEITVDAQAVVRTGPVTHRDPQGSAGLVEAQQVGSATLEPRFDRAQGLQVIVAGASGRHAPASAPSGFVTEGLQLSDDHLLVSGEWRGVEPESWTLRMSDSHTAVMGVPRRTGDGFVVAVPLQTDLWGMGTASLPVGSYRLRVVAGRAGADRESLVPPTEALVTQLPWEGRNARFLVRALRSANGGLALRLAAPLRDHELSPYGQQVLQEWYRSESFPLHENTAYFQAYTGQTATDSPLAIHEELRRRRPDMTLYWGVSDSAAALPEGALPVLMRSREWYAVLGSARYLVSNINFERWFLKRPGQQFLQTFHGYPSKTMGLGLWRSKQFPPSRIALELGRSSRDWDMILTPIPEMDEHYRREYAYHGSILSSGYPRDDVLVGAVADERRQGARVRLGISPGQTAVLYAPTWRDDLATNFRKARAADHLDVEELSAEMGSGFVLLIRGHRFHPRGTVPPSSARIVDVSDYPEINDLILAADVAVLDYSSLRFDFALTGRPMLFLVPDLDEYVQRVRGFLFDFVDSAPGPLLTTTGEVLSCLRDLAAVRAEYGEAIAAFNATYQYTQDGRASERVVQAFFGA